MSRNVLHYGTEGVDAERGAYRDSHDIDNDDGIGPPPLLVEKAGSGRSAVSKGCEEHVGYHPEDAAVVGCRLGRRGM